MAKQVKFLKSEDLISEFQSDENLNEMDFYLLQLEADGVIMRSESIGGRITYEPTSDYLIIFDDEIVQFLCDNGDSTFIAISYEKEFEVVLDGHNDLYIVKIDSQYIL